MWYNLYCGDCILYMKSLINKQQKIDAIITDPPYGTTGCRWDTPIDFEEMWDVINQLSDEHTPILIFGNEPYTSRLICSNLKGFKYRWDWDKVIPSGMSYARYRPMQQTEDIAVFTKSGKKTIYYPQMVKRDKPIYSGGMKKSESAFTEGYKKLDKKYDYKNPTTTIKFMKKRNGAVHPTQKPVELLEYLLKTYTKEGDTVLDFTMGSGSMGVACANLNRNFIGIEIKEEYYNVANNRIKSAKDKYDSSLYGQLL